MFSTSDLLARLLASSSPAIDAAPDALARALDDVKKTSDTAAVELLNGGAAELILQLMAPPPPGSAALAWRASADVSVVLIVEALARLADALGYGASCASPASTAPPSVVADRARRMLHSLATHSSPALDAANPLAYALAQSPSPFGFLNELVRFELHGGGGARTFELRARRFIGLLPLLHAAWLHDPAAFLLGAVSSGALETWLTMLEEIVSVLFLLLPKVCRVAVVQEWAVQLRTTVFPQGVRVPDYEAGWAAINMRVKSTNKFGLAIETVLESLDHALHFFALLSSFSPCAHEVRRSLALEPHEALPPTACAALDTATHMLERAADYAYHAARFLVRWTPLTRVKASCLLSTTLWIEATLAASHPCAAMWRFWWCTHWWCDMMQRIRGVPLGETHADVSPWLRFELNAAAQESESLLRGGGGLVQVGAAAMVAATATTAQAAPPRQFALARLDVCCAPRRLGALRQRLDAILVSLGAAPRSPPPPPPHTSLHHSPHQSTAFGGALTTIGQGFVATRPPLHLRGASTSSGGSGSSRAAGELSPALSALSLGASSSRDSLFTLSASSSATSFASDLDVEVANDKTPSGGIARSPIAQRRPAVPPDPTLALAGMAPYANAFTASFAAAPFSVLKVFSPPQQPQPQPSSMPPPLVARKQCAACGQPERASQFDVCSGCMSVKHVSYCSVACQLAHWPAHKLVCGATPQ